ncbi:serine hydrolase, partial [Richelia intracellularis]|uniref:serine hydrolase n=1 Tax=Richelia intracellularis TaxID=1164990 RepID=UPI0005C6DD89
VTGKLPKIRVRKQGVPKRVRVSRKGRLKPMARTILYVLRLLIVGVGIGAIMGTVLSVLNPAKHINKTDSTNPQRIGQTQAQINQGLGGLNKFLFLSQEILPLKSSVENLLANNTKLTPGIFLVDLDNGNYVDFNAANSFPAASTIKMHILVAFFQDIDNGKIRLYEQLTMEKGLIVGGSGN